MAEQLLKEGTPVTLSFTDAAPADGARYASNAITLGATDATLRPDMVRLDIEATGAAGSAGSAINVYAAHGNAAGEYDGNLTPSVDPGAEVLPNLDAPVSLIVQTTLQRTSAIVQARKARFMVVVENSSGAAATTLKVVATPLSYDVS